MTPAWWRWRALTTRRCPRRVQQSHGTRSAREVEILDAAGGVLRRHEKSARKGNFHLLEEDRLFNPSRETVRLLARVEKIGPNTARFARELFAKLGRPGQRAFYGLANLPRCYARADIDAVCAKLLEAQCVSYATVKHALERRAATACTSAPATTLTQSDPIIRAVGEYQAFWENHSQLTQKE